MRVITDRHSHLEKNTKSEHDHFIRQIEECEMENQKLNEEIKAAREREQQLETLNREIGVEKTSIKEDKEKLEVKVDELGKKLDEKIKEVEEKEKEFVL